MSNLVCSLIQSTLCGKRFECSGVSEEDWQRCFDMALQQNVLAMTFPAMTSLPKDQRPSFVLWSKWMAYAQNVAEQSQYKRQVVETMGAWLAEDGLSTLILKGFSLSALYPNPNLREFSDIDIFSGENYDTVNTCFSMHGENVSSEDGHHAYLKVDGISVEHHFAFYNTKVKRGLEGPEEALRNLVVKDWRPTSLKGIYFPCPVFTALFVGWHAYEHFLQEKIQLRHVIDWVFALKQLSESDAKILIETKGNTCWGGFMDTLTAIALHHLNLPQEWFPQTESKAAKAVTPLREQKVWNDIINTAQTPKSNYSNLRRIHIAKRMLKNNWKFKDYSNINASKLLLKMIVGHVRGRSLTIKL